MRLIKLLKGSGKYIIYQIALQWLSLFAQIAIVWQVTQLIDGAWQKSITSSDVLTTIGIVTAGLIVRYICDRLYSRACYLASVDVKRALRDQIYRKVLWLGPSYRDQIRTSEIVQMTGEGVEQLETYFGRYLSQFLYALLAPFSLFIIISRISLRTAVVLLAAVPLIPIVIMLVMFIAKKILGNYFDIYYGLGDSFLEKMQGMTTLKIYRADRMAVEQIDSESEQFRKITMKVLMMQLNSTSIMDIIAYGGAAAGIISALIEFSNRNINVSGVLMCIFLAAEFFLPMRLLGGFFHIGMNGMKASDRIFAFLDLPEQKRGEEEIAGNKIDISLDNVSFSYDESREVLHDISMNIDSGSLVSIVGVSGLGKSTIAGILLGKNHNYSGSIKVNGTEHRKISSKSLVENFTMIGHNSWIFKGTVRENLLMGNPTATDAELLDALDNVNLKNFLESQSGLDTKVESNASNFSGGQKQRLALARALLHDTPVYIFDEATSNIDADSEEAIMTAVKQIAKKKTVILISHRLANVTDSDAIYMLKNGKIIEKGTHHELMGIKGTYANLFSEQSELENYSRGREEA
ncbi:ABC transporter ATP-binding protein/permease [Mogibacterium diversum]|uniref:ABC transporter ATP-binding protein/permease n=1 Tax=Mogibacterium diversum TaxID=114527 RepID=UPI002F3E32E6